MTIGFLLGLGLTTLLVQNNEQYAIPFAILWAAFMICMEMKK